MLIDNTFLMAEFFFSFSVQVIHLHSVGIYAYIEILHNYENMDMCNITHS